MYCNTNNVLLNDLDPVLHSLFLAIPFIISLHNLNAAYFIVIKALLVLGGLFQKTQLSEVLTEIVKIDPEFEKENFVKECETEIIPNVLEVMGQSKLFMHIFVKNISSVESLKQKSDDAMSSLLKYNTINSNIFIKCI